MGANLKSLNQYLPLNSLGVDEETSAKTLLDQYQCINAALLVLARGHLFELFEEIDEFVCQLLFIQYFMISGTIWLLWWNVVNNI